MTTHAHDTEGIDPIAEPRRTTEGEYVGETDPFAQPQDAAQAQGAAQVQDTAQPQGTQASAAAPTATTQPLAREELPPTRPGDADAQDRAFEPPAAASNLDDQNRTDAPTTAPDPTAASPQPSTGEALFPADDLAGLRSRWNDVQAGFVDDPRSCVQTADGLVSDVVQQLASSFSHARAKLEDQWSRGEDVSTEDLRQALKRYREFFERLLAV